MAAAREAGTPWVLDAVAVGTLPVRTELAGRLVDAGPAIIRGNASEILALAGGGVEVPGACGDVGAQALRRGPAALDDGGDLPTDLLEALAELEQERGEADVLCPAQLLPALLCDDRRVARVACALAVLLSMTI